MEEEGKIEITISSDGMSYKLSLKRWAFNHLTYDWLLEEIKRYLKEIIGVSDDNKTTI